MIPWTLDVAVGWTGVVLALLWLTAATVTALRNERNHR